MAISEGKKRAFRWAAKYLAYFALLFFLSRAEIAGLKPFGYGVYLALAFSGFNILALSPIYVAAAYLADFSLADLLCAGSMAVVLTVAQAIHLKAKRPMRIWQLLIYAVVGQAGYIYIVATTHYNLLNAVLTVSLGLAFTLAAACVFTALVKHKLRFTPDRAETAAAAVVLAALALGFCGIDFYGISLYKAVGVFVCLAGVGAFGAGAGCAAGISFGIGCAFYQDAPELAALFGLTALVASVFSGYNRILAALAAVVVEILFGYYFLIYGDYSYMHLVATVIGAAAFTVVPRGVLERLGEAVFGRTDNYGARYIVNRNRAETAARLKEISKVFDEMRLAFSGLIKGSTNEGEVAGHFCTELMCRLCAECKNSDVCAARGEEVAAAFGDLALCGVKKGRVSLIDIPKVLVSRCGKTADIIKHLNRMSDDFTRYRQSADRLDAAKALVSEQLGGLSEVICELAKETKERIGFDLPAERRLLDELTYADVVAGEAIITEEGGKTVITLLVKTDTIKESVIIKLSEKILKKRMRIVSVEDSPRAGFSVITLGRAPRFDLAIGISGLNKNNCETGGDTHSFTRISDERLMLALCDGMGSGKNAERVSGMAISLIENFYKAGFSTELILTSVNKLLALALDETFSALDIAVVDLNTARCDFIKFGAPPSVIKHRHESDVVGGGALPFGAISDVEPQITSTTLSPYDIVVLCTDGISDVFKEDTELAGYVNNTRIINPQDLAAEIVSFARDKDKQLPHDDMTCLAFRLLPC